MNALEITGAATVLTLAAAALWVLWDFGRYFARGARNTFKMYAALKAEGTPLPPFWLRAVRFPQHCWRHAGASAAQLHSGRWVNFDPDDADEDDD